MTKIPQLSLFLVSALLVSVLGMAQERPDTGGEKRRGGEFRGQRDKGIGGGHMRGEWLEKMKAENPEEFEKLQKLREEDPEAFRQAVRAHVKDRFAGMIGPENAELEKTCRELASEFRLAESDEKKAEIKKQIEEAVRAAFDARLARQKTFVAQLERQLEQLKQQIANREENREVICDQRISELTESPALRW